MHFALLARALALLAFAAACLVGCGSSSMSDEAKAGMSELEAGFLARADAICAGSLATVTSLEAQSKKLGVAAFSKRSVGDKAADLQRQLADVEEADVAEIRALGSSGSPTLEIALEHADKAFHARRATAVALERQDEVRLLTLAELGAAAGARYQHLMRHLGFKACDSLG